MYFYNNFSLVTSLTKHTFLRCSVVVLFLGALLGKKGITPSQIGIILCDSHGVALMRVVDGKKIFQIMKPDILKNLYCLIKKAMSIRKHLERNGKDIESKFRLILIESRIHRLARYYKIKAAPLNWKYQTSKVPAMVA